MSFRLSQRSMDRLEGVHPDMTAVVERAIQLTGIDFGVTQGVRTLDEQKANVAAGRSQTMASKHLLQDDGFSHAVDVVAYVGPDISWESSKRRLALLLHRFRWEESYDEPERVRSLLLFKDVKKVSSKSLSRTDVNKIYLAGLSSGAVSAAGA